MRASAGMRREEPLSMDPPLTHCAGLYSNSRLPVINLLHSQRIGRGYAARLTDRPPQRLAGRRMSMEAADGCSPLPLASRFPRGSA